MSIILLLFLGYLFNDFIDIFPYDKIDLACLALKSYNILVIGELLKYYSLPRFVWREILLPIFYHSTLL